MNHNSGGAMRLTLIGTSGRRLEAGGGKITIQVTKMTAQGRQPGVS